MPLVGDSSLKDSGALGLTRGVWTDLEKVAPVSPETESFSAPTKTSLSVAEKTKLPCLPRSSKRFACDTILPSPIDNVFVTAFLLFLARNVIFLADSICNPLSGLERIFEA